MSARRAWDDPESLSIFDRAAYRLALFEELERATPQTYVSTIIRRAMRRVRRWKEAGAQGPSNVEGAARQAAPQ
jgi:hypothetical protein